MALLRSFRMPALIAAGLLSLVQSREISFPPAAGIQHPLEGSYQHSLDAGLDITPPYFSDLTTYANLPYVHCLASEKEEVEKYDIAILGSPFDTVRTFSSSICPLTCGCIINRQLMTHAIDAFSDLNVRA